MYRTSISGGWARPEDLDRSHFPQGKMWYVRQHNISTHRLDDAGGLRNIEIDPMPMLSTAMSVPETFVCISIHLYMYIDREKEINSVQIRYYHLLMGLRV